MKLIFILIFGLFFINGCSVMVMPRHYTLSCPKEFSGVASWYGGEYIGRPMADGNIYDGDGMTAANNFLPLYSIIKVKNLDNGKEALLTITDRGPFVPGRNLDVSVKAAKVLGFLNKGLMRYKAYLIRCGE